MRRPLNFALRVAGRLAVRPPASLAPARPWRKLLLALWLLLVMSLAGAAGRGD